MKESMVTRKKIIKSVTYVLLGAAMISIPFIVGHFNGGRTPQTTKWNLLVGKDIQYTCLTYNELNMKIQELESNQPKVKYKEKALAGIGSWLCENGWRN